MAGGLTSADDAGAVEQGREQGPARADAGGPASGESAAPLRDPASTDLTSIPPADGVATTGRPASPDAAGGAQHESAPADAAPATAAPEPIRHDRAPATPYRLHRTAP